MCSVRTHPVLITASPVKCKHHFSRFPAMWMRKKAAHYAPNKNKQPTMLQKKVLEQIKENDKKIQSGMDSKELLS